MNFDRGLLEIFSAEQAEHIQRIRTLADSLAAMPADSRGGAVDEILRRAHTLKGAGRAVGLDTTVQLAHLLEALFLRMRESGGPLDDSAIAALHRGLDAMEDVLASAIAERPGPDCSAALTALTEVSAPRAPGIAAPVPDASAPERRPAPEPPPAHVPAVAPAIEFVRVDAATVDGLIRASSQLMVSLGEEIAAAERLDDAARRVAQVFTEFLRLRRACGPYLRAHANDLEAAPLRECLDYADTELRARAAEANSTAAAQHHRGWELSQRVTDVHENAVKVRMIPAESVFGAFGAMVRQIAQDEGKEIEFRAEGLEAQADRLVLQALKDPVMHLLRNAVSHGIEAPEPRRTAGKSPAGSVRLRIDVPGDRLEVTVEDDGRGLDLPAVRNRAIALGLLTRSGAATASPQELAKLIFRPGFSTSETITLIAGRGIGLSVVEETVNRLQGEIQVHPYGHAGLSVRISVALSISTHQLLLLEAGGFVFGLPTRLVQQLVRTRLSGLQTLEGKEVLVIDAMPAPLARLADLLKLPAKPAGVAQDRDPWVSVAALFGGTQTIAIMVDRFLDEREVVVTDLGLPSHMTGMTSGGIPLEDGRVALLLNPAALFERFRDTPSGPPLRPPVTITDKVTQRILVVDDSLTTRSLEKSILEAHGFQVGVAVDGVEALEKLSSEQFDLVITDVMMPRMDGMQLLEQMKRQKATEAIPVIMVTSMESKEDQQRGMSLGADAYIVKRKFDQQELLRTVRQIL